MNQKRIDRLIPFALESIASSGLPEREEITGKPQISSKYFSYLAAIGQSILQAGVIKTLAFYVEESEKADRKKIADLINTVFCFNAGLTNDGKNILNVYLKAINGKERWQQLQLRKRLLEAAAACKLAMMTYKKKQEAEE